MYDTILLLEAKMKIITIEEHYTDKKILEEFGKFKPKEEKFSKLGKEAQDYLWAMEFKNDELFNFEKRLKFMDDNKIDMQVLSITYPISDNTPPDDALKICKMANDITKSKIDKYPKRFNGFAILPMACPQKAAKELERCVKELGLCGAMLVGRYNGRNYNEKEFFPIFKKAAELGVPIFMHPAFVPAQILDTYYISENYSAIVGAEFASAGFGWHVDVGIQIVRLILSGIFDRLPNLKIISGHWGETIPAFLDRIDSVLNKKVTGLKKNISEYYKEHVYITPSGILSKGQFEYLIKVMGAEHIIYAVDYPYTKPNGIYKFLMDSDLTQKQKELIAYKNAKKLLKI